MTEYEINIPSKCFWEHVEEIVATTSTYMTVIKDALINLRELTGINYEYHFGIAVRKLAFLDNCDCFLKIQDKLIASFSLITNLSTANFIAETKSILQNKDIEEVLIGIMVEVIPELKTKFDQRHLAHATLTRIIKCIQKLAITRSQDEIEDSTKDENTPYNLEEHHDLEAVHFVGGAVIRGLIRTLPSTLKHLVKDRMETNTTSDNQSRYGDWTRKKSRGRLIDINDNVYGFFKLLISIADKYLSPKIKRFPKGLKQTVSKEIITNEEVLTQWTYIWGNLDSDKMLSSLHIVIDKLLNTLSNGLRTRLMQNHQIKLKKLAKEKKLRTQLAELQNGNTTSH